MWMSAILRSFGGMFRPTAASAPRRWPAVVLLLSAVCKLGLLPATTAAPTAGILFLDRTGKNLSAAATTPRPVPLSPFDLAGADVRVVRDPPVRSTRRGPGFGPIAAFRPPSSPPAPTTPSRKSLRWAVPRPRRPLRLLRAEPRPRISISVVRAQASRSSPPAISWPTRRSGSGSPSCRAALSLCDDSSTPSSTSRTSGTPTWRPVLPASVSSERALAYPAPRSPLGRLGRPGRPRPVFLGGHRLDGRLNYFLLLGGGAPGSASFRCHEASAARDVLPATRRRPHGPSQRGDRRTSCAGQRAGLGSPR